ncbi:MAG: bifunctional demethylmenaquinone methyltransferase/2-methoxy-6-polyprenyl-1,4-benzoquinol methylase UbiE [Bacillota bacterium]
MNAFRFYHKGAAKEKQVRRFFNAIACKYDAINNIISFGRHRHWQNFAVEQAGIREGGRVLDICCGTGKITIELARRIGKGGRVVGLDLSSQMLAFAAKNLRNLPNKDSVELVLGNACQMPFPENSFDCAMIGYGLRNVADIPALLSEARRVVKPGGRIVSLDLINPSRPLLRNLYHLYLRIWVPLVGRMVAGNKEAYQYLGESVQIFLTPEEIRDLFLSAGFIDVRFYTMTFGTVAVHVGVKPEN